MQSLTSWSKVEAWEGVNPRFFWAYETFNQNALITHIALNLLPRLISPLTTEKSFYVGIVIKNEKVQEIEGVFEKYNSKDGIQKTMRGENEQEYVFLSILI